MTHTAAITETISLVLTETNNGTRADLVWGGVVAWSGHYEDCDLQEAAWFAQEADGYLAALKCLKSVERRLSNLKRDMSKVDSENDIVRLYFRRGVAIERFALKHTPHAVADVIDNRCRAIKATAAEELKQARNERRRAEIEEMRAAWDCRVAHLDDVTLSYLRETGALCARP